VNNPSLDFHSVGRFSAVKRTRRVSQPGAQVWLAAKIRARYPARMLDAAGRQRLKTLYQALKERPLSPDDPAYVDLYGMGVLSRTDPIDRMANCIEFAAIETAQLFSGHRGTGKSTQLRRLKQRLERSPHYKVVICDMEDYLPMTDTVEVVDFLLAAAGALSEALAAPELLGKDAAHENYWSRFVHWVRNTNIEVAELGIGAKASAGVSADEAKVEAEAGVDVKANLKTDPSFRSRIREHMKLHVGAFRNDVHAFMQECLLALRKRHGDDTQLVVIYDSIEHLRGLTTNAKDVADSVERLFRGHADALRVPYLHMVFTVPPWLRLQYPVTADRFDGYYQIPCVKVRARRSSIESAPEPVQDGLDALWTLAARRGSDDWLTWLLGSRAAFDELAMASGGYLRDLLRMLKVMLLDATNGVPVSAEQRGLAIQELRADYLGFTNQEAAWLRQVEETGTLDFDHDGMHHRVATFLDAHVLLAYLNGENWYAVHPVIADDVARRAKIWEAREMDERTSASAEK
jgi:hypothetical protein